MKRIFSLLMATSLLGLAFAQTPTHKTVEIDDMFFNLSEHEPYSFRLDSCKVAKEGNAIVPDSIEWEGKKYVVSQMESAFPLCSKIDSVSLPKTISIIPVGSFAGCTNLKGINLPQDLMNIEKMAFVGCEKLQSITFPFLTQSIDSLAFLKCTGLKKIEIKSFAYVIKIDDSVFSGVDKSIPVIVPKGMVDLYKKAPGWKEFTNITDGTQPTAVNEVEDAPTFSIQNGAVISEEPFTLINLAGQDVTNQNGNLKGTFIVLQNGKGYKVLLQ